MRACPVVKDPGNFGVDEKTPDLGQIEGSHLLANQARPFLEECGFSEHQILAWAETYIAEQGSGDLDAFLNWIDECQECPDRAVEDHST